MSTPEKRLIPPRHVEDAPVCVHVYDAGSLPVATFQYALTLVPPDPSTNLVHPVGAAVIVTLS